jgi:hypothetical protein
MNGSQESLTCEDAQIVNPTISTDPEELRRQKKKEGSKKMERSKYRESERKLKTMESSTPRKITRIFCEALCDKSRKAS